MIIILSQDELGSVSVELWEANNRAQDVEAEVRAMIKTYTVTTSRKLRYAGNDVE